MNSIPGAPGNDYKADQLNRIWIPTERTANSSFSPGYFSNFDSQMSIDYSSSGSSLSFLNVPQGRSLYFVDGLEGDTQDGEFHDLRNASAKKIRLLNSSNDLVTNPASAAKLIVTHWNGNEEEFGIIDLDPDATEVDYAGRLTHRRDTVGRELTITYKTWTNTQIAASPSRQWQIDTVTDEFSNELTFTYDTTQHLGRWCVTGVERQDGPTVTFAYGTDGLESVTFEDGSETTYAYSQNTANDTTVVTTTDVMNEELTGVFELANEYTSGAGNPPGISYNVPGRPLQRKNHDGELAWKQVMPIDPADDAIMVIRAGSATIVYGDGTAQKVSSFSESGGGTEGVQLDRKLPSQYVTSMALGFAGYDVALDTTVYGLDATTTQLDQLIPAGATDERGVEKEYEYDSNGNRTKITYTADSTFEEFSYNTFAQETRRRDRTGNVTLKNYDSQGLLTSVETGILATTGGDVHQGEYAVTTYEYYPSTHANAGQLQYEKGPLWSSTNATLHRTDYEYNSDGQVTKITGPAAVASGTRPETTFSYNTAKQLASKTDPRGLTINYEYDTMGRLVKTTYPDSSTEQTLYAAPTSGDAGHVVKTKDRVNTVTYLEYDDSGRVTSTTVGAAIDTNILDGNADDTVISDVNLKNVTVITYKPGSDSLKASVTVNGAKTDYVYDIYNRLTEVKQYPRSGQTLSSKKAYEAHQLLYDEDPYGRRKYYGYRASDGTLIRTVTCTVPSYTLSNFAAVWALTRSTSANATYVIHDAIRDADGRLTQIIDGRNVETRYTYDSQGRETVKREAYGTGVEAKTETDYDLAGHVVTVRQPRYFDSGDTEGYQKAKETWTYDGRGQVLTHKEAVGSSIEATESFTYTIYGAQATHTDFAGKVWSTIDDSCCGKSTASKNPLGHGSIRNTDPAGRVVHTATVSDVDSHTADMLSPVDAKTVAESTTKYDSLGRVVATTTWLSARGAITPTAPPIAGLGGVSASSGLTTQYLYDNNLTDDVGLDSSSGISYTKMAASGTSAVSLADAISKLASAQTSGGADISFTSSAPAKATVVINAQDEVSFSITDAAGRTVMSGQLDNYSGTANTLLTWSSTLHDTATTISGYGDCLETKSIDALGNASSSLVDGAGRTIRSIDQLGKATNYTYDAAGNRLTVRDPNNVGQDVVYDNLGRAGLTTDTSSDTTNSSYDKAGNRISATDGKSHSTAYVFDARGRQKSQTDRISGATSFTYRATGQLASLTDAESQVTSYIYDDAGQKLTEQYPDHTSGTPGQSTYGIVTFTNDAAGRVLRKQDQKGDTCTFTYDLAGRLTQRDYRLAANSPSGSIADSDTFTYDKAGRMLTAGSGRYSNTVTYTYDTAGRKKTEALTVSGVTYTTTSAYNERGELTSLTYPDSTVVDREYTDRGELYRLKHASTVIDTRGYDDGGRMTSSAYNNGVSESRSYGTDNTLSSISFTGASIGNLSYAWDDNKNKTAETIGGTMSGYGFSVGSSGYDNEDRLVNFNRTDGNLDQSWSLSNVGDWNSVTTEGTAQSRTHGPTHELTAVAGSSVTTDVGGNITLIPSAARPNAQSLLLNWDFDNRLSTADVGNNSSVDVTYKFDALGRRVYRQDSSSTTVYVQAGQQTIADYVSGTAASSPTYRYVYASYIDEPVFRYKPTGSESIYFHRNQQYSVVALTNGSGSIVERYAYSAYGVPTIADSSGSVLTSSAYSNRYTYTGREWDPVLLMYHYRARMYDANLGRFCSRDPIGFGGESYNLMRYGNGRPFDNVDPTGNISIRPIGSPTLAGCGGTRSQPYDYQMDGGAPCAGYLIQEIEHCCAVKKCDNGCCSVNIEPPLKGGGGGDLVCNQYWELWEFKKKGDKVSIEQTRLNPIIDTASVEFFANSCGYYYARATAKFFCKSTPGVNVYNFKHNQTTSGPYQSKCKTSPGRLRRTLSQPTFWLSTSESASASRTVTADWSCCSAPGRVSAIFTPPK